MKISKRGVINSRRVAVVDLPSIKNIPTRFCLSCIFAPWWGYKDGNLLRWLPKRQPETPARRISIYDISGFEDIFEISSKVLSTPLTRSVQTLEKMLVEQRLIMTLQQINMLLKGELSVFFKKEKISFFLYGGFNGDKVCIGRVGYVNRDYYILLSVLGAGIREHELLVSPGLIL